MSEVKATIVLEGTRRDIAIATGGRFEPGENVLDVEHFLQFLAGYGDAQGRKFYYPDSDRVHFERKALDNIEKGLELIVQENQEAIKSGKVTREMILHRIVEGSKNWGVESLCEQRGRD